MRGVFWRRALDWGVRYIPWWLHPPLSDIIASIFYVCASGSRRAIHRNLALVLPASSPLLNRIRAWMVFRNYARSLIDSALYRIHGVRFDFVLTGEEHLRALAAAPGAIILTAHMGNYDLGAALFATKYAREFHMVRAPEPDAESERHMQQALTQKGEVKIDYNTAMISFDLLRALRAGEIVSIQGDRVIPGVAVRATSLFGQPVELPEGPFSLGYVADVPIYFLFITRLGRRRYGVTTFAPLRLRAEGRNREQALQLAMDEWARTLGDFTRAHWSQWFAFSALR
ncbi:MAG: hypothetical protein M3R59_04930 [Verrucomicrobiota bacterium]|nr:hypothetical protein [Verrucomicrobiota bacterium]